MSSDREDGNNDVDEAISVVEYLESPDGRRFYMKKWSPTVDYKTGEITIRAVMVVELPDDTGNDFRSVLDFRPGAN